MGKVVPIPLGSQRNQMFREPVEVISQVHSLAGTAMPYPATAPGRARRLAFGHAATEQVPVEIAGAFLLANHNGPQPSPDMRVHVLPVPHRFLAALPVIGHPTLEIA